MRGRDRTGRFLKRDDLFNKSMWRKDLVQNIHVDGIQRIVNCDKNNAVRLALRWDERRGETPGGRKEETERGEREGGEREKRGKGWARALTGREGKDGVRELGSER